MSLEREIERGQRIAELIGNEYAQEAIAEIEAEIVAEWKSGATLADRELAADKYRGLEALNNMFRRFVDGGLRARTILDKAER